MQWREIRLRCRRSQVLLAFLVTVAVSSSLSFAADSEIPFRESEREYWSLRPRARPDVPRFQRAEDLAWLRSVVDAFVLERLNRGGLRPAVEAERSVLVRRLFFDLLGLPPSPAEVQEFLDDPRPDAYERLVDRLLASPRYGEQWGQHWLDVARFGETEGFEYDQHRPGAWRYRDYVIESFNADVPYDRFVREQLAGDELPDPSQSALVAVGFHRLGPVRRNAGNSDVSFSRNEVLTEMTDAVGAVFLGLTLACARCHDHKFDPIRQKDYYRMQAFLATAHEHDVQLAPPEQTRLWNEQTDRVKSEMKRIREVMQSAQGQERDKLVAQLKGLERELPPPLPTISTVWNKEGEQATVHVLARGDTDKKKELVGPRILGVLALDSGEYPHNVSRPRTLLAEWLTSPNHPLTARVLVNRVWQGHFGQGIVATPNDFGANGSSPTHPELLDELGNRLIAGGWQIKPLHRLLVTSSVYRQASSAAHPEEARRLDPTNRWLSRFQRRRLAAEPLRDALLAIAGRLNEQLGGPSVLVPVEQELVDLLYKPSQWEVTGDKQQHDRRSVYLLAKRNLRVPFLEVFDQPDLQSSCPRRATSTHSPQALEMLNGRFANELADAFAARLIQEAGSDPASQVDLAFRLATGRSPTSREAGLAVTFLQTRPLREFALAVFSLNAFLYVD